MPMKPEVPSEPITSAMRANGMLRDTAVIEAPNGAGQAGGVQDAQQVDRGAVVALDQHVPQQC